MKKPEPKLATLLGTTSLETTNRNTSLHTTIGTAATENPRDASKESPWLPIT
jgi:hypothetical protein